MAGKHLLPLTIALLSANSITAVFSQKIEDNPWSRPSQFVNSWGELHSRVGSYYNGSVSLNFDISPNSTDTEDEEYPGDACRSADSLTLDYDGFVRIGRPDPRRSRENTAIALSMLSWDQKFAIEDMSGFPIRSDMNYESFRMNAEKNELPRDEDEESSPWKVSVDSAEDDGYRFNITLLPNFPHLPFNRFYLNFTEPCTEADGPPPSDDVEDYYAFHGRIRNPNDTDSISPKLTPPEIETPQVEGRFDGEEATFSLVASYKMTADGTLIQGVMNVTFSGTLDPEISDELLLGQDKPDWKPTVGLEQEDGGNNEEDGASTAVANLVLACGMMAFVMGFLMA